MDGPAQVGLNEVGMNELAYITPHVEVTAGTTVTWTNNEDIEHDVLFIDGTAGSPLLVSPIVRKLGGAAAQALALNRLVLCTVVLLVSRCWRCSCWKEER